MPKNSTRIHFLRDAKPQILTDQTIAVIGYGNQGRAQALNLRDRGLKVIIGNRSDHYRSMAQADGFRTEDIPVATSEARIVFVLLPDEELPSVYSNQVQPNLQEGAALVFASGYVVAFDQIALPQKADVLLLAPRMIGVGVRERFLTEEGFYCFVGVHQDASGKAYEKLLALTSAIGGLLKPAIEVTFKQEAMLDLFNEQAFGPAFGRILLSAIKVLLDNGLPAEAVLVEMYLSEEMAYTYRKMAEIGLVQQVNFHSHTSQYGALSRGVRFLGMRLKKRMDTIFSEIDKGDFAREWNTPLAQLRLRALKFFATRQRINQVEQNVRRRLGLPRMSIEAPDIEGQALLRDPRIQAELEAFKTTFEF